MPCVLLIRLMERVSGMWNLKLTLHKYILALLLAFISVGQNV